MIKYYCYFPLYYGSIGGVRVILGNFLLSIVAGVISYYICKWLDRHL